MVDRFSQVVGLSGLGYDGPVEGLGTVGLVEVMQETIRVSRACHRMLIHWLLDIQNVGLLVLLVKGPL